MRNANGRANSDVQHPLPFLANIELTHRFRFVANAALAAVQIYGGNLGLLACLGTSVTRVYSIFKSLRLKRIEIFAPPGSQGTAATCSIDWSDSAGYICNREVSDTSVSVASPAHLITGPPQNAAPGWWQQIGTGGTVSNTAKLFSISCPSGSIIDVTVGYVVCDGASTCYSDVATAVVGTTYCLPLDFGAGNHLNPVSLNTTV